MWKFVVSALLLTACGSDAPDGQPQQLPATERFALSAQDAQARWDSLGYEPYASLVDHAACAPATAECRVHLRGAEWSAVPADQRRELVQGIGRAGVVAQGVNRVVFVDAGSREELATFSGATDAVTLK